VTLLFAFLNLQGDPVQGRDTAKIFMYLIDFQKFHLAALKICKPPKGSLQLTKDFHVAHILGTTTTAREAGTELLSTNLTPAIVVMKPLSNISVAALGVCEPLEYT